VAQQTKWSIRVGSHRCRGDSIDRLLQGDRTKGRQGGLGEMETTTR
jgi:hypothetical protein